MEAQYYLEPAAAYACVVLPGARGESDSKTVEAALAAGVRLYGFKRSSVLPRAVAVIGALRSIAPTDLLDVGTGRGVFLWPLLDCFPDLRVTALETGPPRARTLAMVARGGIGRLDVVAGDVRALGFAAGAFDVVTCLEVLEHLVD